MRKKFENFSKLRGFEALAVLFFGVFLAKKEAKFNSFILDERFIHSQRPGIIDFCWGDKENFIRKFDYPGL